MLEYLPEVVSTVGIAHDHLFTVVYYITAAIFVLVNVLIVYFVIKYRYREGRKAYHFHGSMPVEFTWTLLPTLLFAGLGFYSDDLWTDMKYQNRTPKADVEIDVLGQTFMWHYRYPGADGVLGKRSAKFMAVDNIFGVDPSDPFGKDDIVMTNRFSLPINKTIVVHLSSVDVLHSFFLPHFRVKQDAVPGMWINVWFDGLKPGMYELACAELCGPGHYNMRGELTMLSAPDYDAWMNEQIKNKLASMQPAAPAPAAEADTTGADLVTGAQPSNTTPGTETEPETNE